MKKIIRDSVWQQAFPHGWGRQSPLLLEGACDPKLFRIDRVVETMSRFRVQFSRRGKPSVAKRLSAFCLSDPLPLRAAIKMDSNNDIPMKVASPVMVLPCAEKLVLACNGHTWVMADIKDWHEIVQVINSGEVFKLQDLVLMAADAGPNGVLKWLGELWQPSGMERA